MVVVFDDSALDDDLSQQDVSLPIGHIFCFTFELQASVDPLLF